MFPRYRQLFILLLCIFLIWKLFQYYGLHLKQPPDSSYEVNPTPPNVVEVTVYYEALCSDSRNFIIKHLLPTYTLLSSYIKLNLVPYGKAKTIHRDDGNIDFECQHTKVECTANKIHACAIEQIEDPFLQLRMVTCMIDDNFVPFSAAEKCANGYGVDYEPLSNCANDLHGSLLLKQHGIKTHAVRPAITFIPTIELNGSQKIPLPKLLKDFQAELCNFFPKRPKECA